MSDTPKLDSQSGAALNSTLAEEKKQFSANLSPLTIALQEYAYWRDCETAGDPDDHFECIAIGAIGASANIIGRLSGANLEGITYKTLTPDQITAALMELKLAPRLAIFLKKATFFSQVREALQVTSRDGRGVGTLLDEADSLLEELEKAGAL